VPALLLIGAVDSSLAHHSRAEFARGTMHEIEGEVVEVIWRNPHVRLRIETRAVDGAAKIWELEAGDAGTQARRGLTADLIGVGDRVRAAGLTSERRDNLLTLEHVLLASGTELLFRDGQSRWSNDTIGGTRAAAPEIAVSGSAADGLFRVWFRMAGTPYEVLEQPPLTASARAAWEAYDPLRDDPVFDCVLPGMPRVITMAGSRPIAFEQRGEDILMISENYNRDRLIHMDADADLSAVEPTPLGYSRGHWDGNTLIVTTTHISWPFFELPPLYGVPQSQETEIVERFTLDEDRLVYDFRAYDPVNFTEPIEANGYFVWRWEPDIRIRTNECEPYGRLDTEN
jgi:hypothetical protein